DVEPREGGAGAVDDAVAPRLPPRGAVAASERPPRTSDQPPGGTLMARIIEVTVSPEGETTVQTKGYAGPECRQASQFLEHARGLIVQDRTPPAFHPAPQARQQAQQ